MPIILRHSLVAGAGALTLLVTTGVLGQTGGQQPPVGTQMPSNQQQEGVIRPAPDVHGRSGGGTAQQHGNDAASPSADMVEDAAKDGACDEARQQAMGQTAADCASQADKPSSGQGAQSPQP